MAELSPVLLGGKIGDDISLHCVDVSRLKAGVDYGQRGRREPSSRSQFGRKLETTFPQSLKGNPANN
ncbi:hypothetical protein Nepgr_016661 [Nepenthes gracilis]|uniref:Uncharacterized protein n=1 Tax=Nepenthes gracilis TaxID=150966 RepID=A0AAD3XSP5_NEPGR|nr:hypothetical protein Nepgr_016661 [Nepenthes gracilis]